jgi:glutathione S-transferase
MRLYDYAASANCFKVRLLLAQLGRPYERVPVDIFAGGTLTDDFARKNPARTTPVLETDDGRFLPESNAILWYLADRTPFLAEDPLDRAQVIRWLLFEQTDVVPGIGGLRFRLLTGRWTPDHPEAVKRREVGLATLSLLDEHLRGLEFLVGERYGIADVAVYGYTHAAAEAGFDLATWPQVEAWLRRVEEQPRFVNDLEPYPPNARPGVGTSTYG